ncbi:MAG: hypothetical protein J7K68_01605 [Candidatus Diapherotrites archaeon]|nr:hypothetical protein [Candidatus Diapherotrites archaeon]
MKVLVRYGELFLKSEPVKKRMINQLVSNIKAGIPDANVDIKRGRLIINTEFGRAKPILKRIFGIVSFSPAFDVTTDMEQIKKQCLMLVEPNKTFAIKTNRPYKKFPMTSQEISREVGAYIVKHTGAKVNLTNPEQTIYIELFKDTTFIFNKIERGIEGLPLGVSGTVCLECYNKDDVLAGLMMMKRGCSLIVKGNRSNILDEWSIGHPITYVDSFKECKAVVSGTRDINKIKGREVPVFYPLIALPDCKIKELRKTFYLA